MRYRGVRLCPPLTGRVCLVRSYSTTQTPRPPPTDPKAPPTDPTPPSGAEVVKERALAVLQHVGEFGRVWGQRSLQAASTSVTSWWSRYEEFVGLNEVKVAQTKVTEAEAAFMVSRGMVREALSSLEVLQVRLKEVRDRLDRVSREEEHYLELATLEHKLLQEERRLRTAYENAEGSEREKFSLFSAGVRESHEKERTRAERTKNWSIIGSVLGALIGVLGSTYVNRVRLQELKTLLLEAQKGPESLQDALRVQAGVHRSQNAELQTLIQSLRTAVSDAAVNATAVLLQDGTASVPPAAANQLQAVSRRAESLMLDLRPQLEQLEQGLGRLEAELTGVRTVLETSGPPHAAPPQGLGPPHAAPPQGPPHAAPPQGLGPPHAAPPQGPPHAAPPQGLEPPHAAPPQGPEPPRAAPPQGPEVWEPEAAVLRRLEETQRILGNGIRTNTVYNAVFSAAAAVTVCAVILLSRGNT